MVACGLSGVGLGGRCDSGSKGLQPADPEVPGSTGTGEDRVGSPWVSDVAVCGARGLEHAKGLRKGLGPVL